MKRMGINEKLTTESTASFIFFANVHLERPISLFLRTLMLSKTRIAFEVSISGAS